MINVITWETDPQNNFQPFALEVFNDLYDWVQDRLPGFQKGPFEIVCGTLSVEENKARGAMPRSRHLLGEAIDIRPVPNYDDSKCIVATFAESIIIKKRLGSEIAIKWGIDGHVHIAVVPMLDYHKRFSIDGGEVWSSVSQRNKRAVRKILGKYDKKFVNWR